MLSYVMKDRTKPLIAERISGVRFVTLDRGGHLLLGQQERVKAELADFLGSAH